MKDYYEILGVPVAASPDEIKSSFRKMAFEHHPDKNPGNERESEERFKEINEAYGVIGDETKRREYDAFRNGRSSGAGFNSGFGYSQEDIFNSAFSNQAIFEELNRMFAQMGLRFDDDFRSQTFFGGRGVRFQHYGTPSGAGWGPGPSTSQQTFNGASFGATQPVVRKPNYAERMMGKAIGKMSKYALKKGFGIDLDFPLKGEDIHKELKVSTKEASQGCAKRVRYKRGKEKKAIEVTVPSGIESGKKIKLSGMGAEGVEPGDLYLHIRVR